MEQVITDCVYVSVCHCIEDCLLCIVGYNEVPEVISVMGSEAAL